jgi:FdrA protein
VMQQVIARAGQAGKPVVVVFLGGASLTTPANVSQTHSLFDCAQTCVALSRKAAAPAALALPKTAQTTKPAQAASQKYIRGLFAGGTFATEAQVTLKGAGVSAWSNVPLDAALELTDLHASREHTILDLGDDAFTVGKPHPMIDPSTRVTRIAQEAADPATAVILIDIVLGYAGHMNPAGALHDAIEAAQRNAQSQGRRVIFVAFVCGTEEDPQVRSAQEKILTDAGCLLATSSTQAAQMAAALVAA